MTSTRKRLGTCDSSANRWVLTVARISMIEAIRDAMDVMMQRDERVVGFWSGRRVFWRRISLH